MAEASAQFAPTSALAVARFFIEKAAETGRQLTSMQLLKLVYIAHGWSLAFFDRDLICEDVKAWQYGPVIPAVYGAVKRYGGNPIDSTIAAILPPLPPDADRDALLTAVFKNYSMFTGPQLSTMTHRAGTPWDVTWNVLGGKNIRGATINRDLIKAHYRSLGDNNTTAATPATHA